MKKLKRIIEDHNPDAVICGFKDIEPKEIKKGSWYTISNFPNMLNQVIIDYVDCHYKVIKQDQFSITFKN